MSTYALDSILARSQDATRDQLIPLLQEIQEAEGYLTQEAILRLARHLNLPASKVYGVATFYNQFRFAPNGQFHIQVCRGTACHVKGSAKVLDALTKALQIQPGGVTRDHLFSIEVVACVGACGLAPVISVNGEYHAGVKPEEVDTILDSYRERAQTS